MVPLCSGRAAGRLRARSSWRCRMAVPKSSDDSSYSVARSGSITSADVARISSMRREIEQGSKLLKLSTRFPERKLVP